MRIDLRTSLTDVLGVSRGDLVSIVGAGGKTSLMYGLGKELSLAGHRTLLTTTTRLLYPRPSEVSSVILGPETDATARRITGGMKSARTVLAGLKKVDTKITGFSPEFVERLHSDDEERTVVAECDGAMGRSLKVPRETEPPLAGSTTVYIVVVGADSFHKPLTSREVFNPEDVARVAGVELDSEVSQPVLMEAILSSESYLGRRPGGARLVILINKVDTGRFDQHCFRGGGSPLSIGLALKEHPDVDRVAIGSLQGAGRSGFLVLR
ncbi:MAG: selenium cofactor biosynthesis protein YqeC [Candidatus Eisenbacteria bacterium]